MASRVDTFKIYVRCDKEPDTRMLGKRSLLYLTALMIDHSKIKLSTNLDWEPILTGCDGYRFHSGEYVVYSEYLQNKKCQPFRKYNFPEDGTHEMTIEIFVMRTQHDIIKKYKVVKIAHILECQVSYRYIDSISVALHRIDLEMLDRIIRYDMDGINYIYTSEPDDLEKLLLIYIEHNSLDTNKRLLRLPEKCITPKIVELFKKQYKGNFVDYLGGRQEFTHTEQKLLLQLDNKFINSHYLDRKHYEEFQLLIFKQNYLFNNLPWTLQTIERLDEAIAHGFTKYTGPLDFIYNHLALVNFDKDYLFNSLTPKLQTIERLQKAIDHGYDIKTYRGIDKEIKEYIKQNMLEPLPECKSIERITFKPKNWAKLD